MKVCENHQDKKIVPLIWTFIFRGAEYWCPACGYTSGMFGAGEDIEETEELKETAKTYEIKTNDFRMAMAHRNAESFMWEGERIKPDELPDEEKAKDKSIIDSWRYKY